MTLRPNAENWNSRKNFLLPAPKQFQQTRDLLKERGIPHAAFYELVDFDDQLSPEQQALLETQLMETGLLDALVLPESAKEDAAVILAEHPDHFLNLENTPKATAPVALRPASEAPAWADVADLLCRISSLPEGTVYFPPTDATGRALFRAVARRCSPPVTSAHPPAGKIAAARLPPFLCRSRNSNSRFMPHWIRFIG